MSNDGDPDGDIIGLAGYDVDDGNGLTVKEVEGVGYLVTVAPGAAARPTFRYRISDGRSDPVGAVVVVAVTDDVAVDQPPVARADVTEVRAGGKVHVPVLENDYDPEGGALEVVDVTPWEGVDVAPGLNGQTVDVRVGAGVTASFTLSYTVADTAGNRASAFVDVRIVPPDQVNRPPIARTDISRTQSGVGVEIAAVANDSDPDGDIIAVESISTQPTGGVATVEAGTVVYTPNDTFAGTDRFTYSLVDAGGEIAIGEVLVGVMPLSAENRAPEAFDDVVQAIAGSAPLEYDVLDNDSDPDGDTLRVTTVGTPTNGAAEVAAEGAGVVFTPPAAVTTTDGSPQEVAFTYAIDDGRGGTAQATVTVEVIAAGEALAPVAVDDMVGPIAPGQSVEIDLLANDLDPDGNPAELVVGSDDAALADRDGSIVTIVAGPTSSRHAYTITDPSGLTDTAEVDVLVVPNRAPVVAAVRGADPGEHPAHDRPRRPGLRPGRRHALLRLLRQPAGRIGHDGDERRRRAVGVVRPRRRLRRAGVVRLQRRRPAGPQRRRRGRRSRCCRRRTGRRSAEDTILTVEAGTPLTIDLAALVTDPDPNDTLTYTSTGPSAGAVALAASGATVVATAPLEGTDTTDSFQYTVTDAAGAAATATVSLTVTAPAAPPPQAQGDQATTNQGQAVTVAVLGNDLDPLGRGLRVTSVGATSAGSATTDGADGDVLAEPRLLRPGVVHLPRPRRRQHRPARGRGAGRHHGHRPAVGTGHARGPGGQRDRRRDVGRAAVERRADRRLRAAHRGRRVAFDRHGDRLHVERPHQRRAGRVQRPSPQQRRLGSRGAVRRPPSRPTSSRAVRRPRRCSSPTAR